MHIKKLELELELAILKKDYEKLNIDHHALSLKLNRETNWYCELIKNLEDENKELKKIMKGCICYEKNID